MVILLHESGEKIESNIIVFIHEIFSWSFTDMHIGHTGRIMYVQRSTVCLTIQFRCWGDSAGCYSTMCPTYFTGGFHI